ncbi:uncharacterized protein LOC129307857 isoform X2 [Prosopis cineraria]|uniref:uncharacterized protein LOC129307857 isoform X2 n=1 Tax=Prosopis cineraria TaxID=364024 RepID=UPI0024109321|nr:uncharacterized protein LOC129307857 isoform X2 [Prosopis cineraria]
MESRLKRRSGTYFEGCGYGVGDEEHATAIAATAFAIYSLHLSNLRELPISSSKTITTRQDSTPNLTRAREHAFPVRPSPQNQRTPIPARPNDFKTRADVWEKANMQKIHGRYEKIKSKILSWETEQKMQAKLQLERKGNRTTTVPEQDSKD